MASCSRARTLAVNGHDVENAENAQMRGDTTSTPDISKQMPR